MPNFFRAQTDYVWKVICGFLNNLSKEEILDAREQFCDCVNSIIEAYEQKLREVKFWKNLTREKNRIIKQLEHRVSELTEQLASKVCEKCGNTGIPTEEFSSLSVEENTDEVIITLQTVTDFIYEGRRIKQLVLRQVGR